MFLNIKQPNCDCFPTISFLNIKENRLQISLDNVWVCLVFMRLSCETIPHETELGREIVRSVVYASIWEENITNGIRIKNIIFLNLLAGICCFIRLPFNYTITFQGNRSVLDMTNLWGLLMWNFFTINDILK